MNKESYFISCFSNSRIGDDGAVVGNYVYSMDAFFENVHFKREWMSLEAIARKAMLVNISDAIAMNASPRYALLTVAMPKSITTAEMTELVRGFEASAREFGIEIIGGDTIANVKLDISVTIISECSRPLRRNTLKCGEFLAFTGTLGKVKKELATLLRGGSVNPNGRFVSPTLRRDFIKKAAPYLTGGMDISDGLFTELERLSRLNRLDFRFLRPVDALAACSGEEYEMLVAFKAEHREKIEAIAAKTRTPLTLFAVTRRGRFKSRCKANHF
jgi:thiamine-monophosphate kinase